MRHLPMISSYGQTSKVVPVSASPTRLPTSASAGTPVDGYYFTRNIADARIYHPRTPGTESPVCPLTWSYTVRSRYKPF